MSNAAKERIEEFTESNDSLITLFKQWYHVPTLIALMTFMLVVRLRALGNFQIDGGVTFRGNDPWYHFRESMYLLDNFPSTLPFDAWTNYPSGTSADQFGTLFDQIVTGFILLTSFGNPSGEYAGLIMLVAAPVFLVLAVIPTYLIAARFAGRGPALAGILVLALLPGTVLNYSLVGFYDHHAAEVFFQTLAVLAFIVALAVAQREQPIWELVVDRDVAALRKPLAYSAAAGVAAALYMWAWPPGVLLVGFTGIFFAVKLTSDVFHDRTPEPAAFVGVVSMTVTGLLMFVPLTSFSISGPTSFSLLQVILPLGVAAGCVFLAALARQWEARDLQTELYPVTVGGLLVAILGVLTVALPSLVRSISSNFLNTVGFSARDTTQTIGEATPLLARGPAFEVIYTEYGLALITAIIAALVVLARPLVRSDNSQHTIYVAASLSIIGLIYLASPVVDAVAAIFGTSWQIIGLVVASSLLVGATFLHRYDSTELYLLVWAAFITSAAFTQIRFNYYLAIVVAVFNAIFVVQVLGVLDLKATGDSIQESVKNLEGWQIMVAVTVLLIITVPLLIPLGGSAWAAGSPDRNGPGEVTQWEDSLVWMSEETPYPGELEGADNAMDYYGTFERPEGDYEYPEGAYGVQSWWDYGHWITVNGERIPNANPFQQGATEAANYLLAPSEDRAADALDQKMGEAGETRYVMVDWEMTTPGAKFGAPIIWYDDEDLSQGDFFEPLYQQNEQNQPVFTGQQIKDQRFYDSQMIRLYEYHGSAADPEPVVVEWDEQVYQDQDGQEVTVREIPPGQDSAVQTFDTIEEAEEYVEDNPNAQLGGVGANPTERVDALENYRLVKASESSALNSNQYLQSQFQTVQQTQLGEELSVTDPHWVKTFERIPGATLEGSGAPAGEEVRATVEMQIPEGGQSLALADGQLNFQQTDGTFTYTQYATADENGNFEMTLPYSTTGYDDFGPENGYTNVSVQALDEYTFTTEPQTDDELTTTQFIGQTDVDEAQVVGADDSTVTVELSEETLDEPEGAQ